MSGGRLEFKVGLFVIVLLGLAAVMSIKFSETGFGLRDTYSLTLRTSNAGTIIRDSPVLMSGVKIGYVDSFDLTEDGSEVLINVELYPEYSKVVREGVTFRIKSTGFLGDQFIGVFPGETFGAELAEGTEHPCESPFDVEQVGQKVSGLIDRVDGAVKKIDLLVGNVNTNLLSSNSVENITAAIAEFRVTSEKLNQISTKVDGLITTNGPTLTAGVAELSAFAKELRGAVQTNAPVLQASITNFNTSMANFSEFTDQLREAMDTNAPAIHTSVTNFAAFTRRLHASAGELEVLIATNAPTVQSALSNIETFSVKLDKTTADLQSTLANNRTNITAVVENLATATESIKGITQSANRILMEIESGQGLAGGLLKNEEMRLQFQAVLTNLNGTATHFSNLASNLNARGIFYKPKPERLVNPPRSVKPK
tara:strand:+ start:1511 stop:2788 length:1278 start_codon:yes stop_codon:yes gene_type:complete